MSIEYLFYSVAVLLTLAFIAFQFFPYFKLKSSRGNTVSSLNQILSPEQQKEQRMLIYFMAPQCGMCKNITPIIDELATERNDVIRIDASKKPEIAREFNVMGTPAFVLVENGIVGRVKLGGMSRNRILKMLENSPQ